MKIRNTDRLNRLVALALLTGISLANVACVRTTSEGMFNGFDEGRIDISADRAGMEAFSDFMNGAITNGKASPDKTTASWQSRDLQIATRGRKFAVGQKLNQNTEGEK